MSEVKANLQPPKSVEEARKEIISLRAEIDSGKVPWWRLQEIERRLVYLRGWLHAKGEKEIENLVE